MRTLVVEDHPALARQVMDALAEAGFVADHAADGEEGHFLGDTEPYDPVVLDLGLPVLDGLTVLKRWRSAGRDMPVLILTARDGWSEKVAGLNAGADDYLAKPFVMAELVARVQALVRRAHGRSRPEIALGRLVVDTAAQRVTLDGAAVRLTGLEYLLFGERGLLIAVEGDPGARVRVDPQDLAEMLGNLMEDACKWARRCVGVTIAVAGRSVTVPIGDDGPGLPDDRRDAVLGRGVRLDERMAGSGLGLAIVSDLTALHGGSLEIGRAAEGGLVAMLRLPRQAAAMTT